jgi:high-affinity iron transporter
MGLRFIGGAIQELQEQTLLPVDVADVPDWAISLGLNPSWEAIGTQCVIAVIAVLSVVFAHRQKADQVKSEPVGS